MFYIVTSEYCLYLFFKDFPIFIDRLADKLSAINILYVKVFQAIALNNSLIDDSINNKLLLYTDNAPWTADDILYKELILLAREENLTTEENFFVPINSGMISLVFKYTQKETNKDVIVKMKRQGIDEKLEAAIENLEACLYLLSFIPIINKYQITNVVLKNIDMIISQTNFDEEVKNMVKMKENCKNLKYVKIPTVYPDVTKRNPSFILMDYIDGLKITQIKKEDYEGFAKVVMKYGFVTSIVHGFTHGDLHGGNILFIKDDHDEKYPHKIGVLDFGIVYNIDATYKTLLFEVFTEMFTVPVEETAEKLLCSGIIEPMDILKNLPCDKYNDILEFTTDIVRETITGSKKANQIQIYKLLSKLKEYLSNNEIADLGIRPSDNFVKSQLVLAMAHGVTLTLCEDDFITVADTVINELFHTNIIM
jgi:predicted unusual protein kinase regulating ubiquinone biosynthesis (AarF/ABC1/UbiB family)